MRFKKQQNKTLDRFNNAVNILLKYGVVSIASNSNLKRFLQDKDGNQRFNVDPDLNQWQRIRCATQELGPTAVYFAKFLCSRPDILPQQLITEFQNLAFNNQPFAKQSAIEIFEHYTRRRADMTFSYFDNYCYQQDGFTRTYRAKLLSGEDVSVKLMLSDSIANVTADIKLLRRLAGLTSNLLSRLGVENPHGIIDDFEYSMLPKLDLNNEAEMVKRFAKAYKGMKDFVVPDVFSQFTSSNTLVTTYTNTTSIVDADEFTKWGLDHKRVADNFLRTCISGMLDSGLFLSSIMDEVVRISPTGQVIFIDFGSTMMLTTEQRNLISDIVAALTTQNSKVLADSIRKIAISPEISDYQAFKSDVQNLTDNLFYLESSEHYMREFAFGIMRIAYRHKVNMPREVLSAFGSLAEAENIALSITPTCRISEFFKPYGKKLQLERMSPEKLRNKFNQNLSMASDFLETSPLELSIILKKLRRGQLYTNLNVSDFKSFIRRIDISSNKLVYSLIICALMVCSTLVMVFGKGGYVVLGLPVVSLIGYSLSLLITIMLVLYTIGTSFQADDSKDDEDE